MALYKLHPLNGVFRTDTGQHIPCKPGNPEWEAYVKWFREGNLPEPPEIITPPEKTIEDYKREKLAEVDLFAARLRVKFLPNISAAEMASWSIKEKLARDYINSLGSSDPGLLAVEAAARGITLSELITKVLDKANAYQYLEGTISGLNGKHNDTIKSLSTIDEVVNYNFTTGWPEP